MRRRAPTCTQVLASLEAAAVPMLDGAPQCSAAGYLSSLHAENARVAAAVQGGVQLGAGATAVTFALLVDPQTCEGCPRGGGGWWGCLRCRCMHQRQRAQRASLRARLCSSAHRRTP